MTRFLVIYISQEEFCTQLILGKSLGDALDNFMNGPWTYDEIYSITIAR